MTFKEFLKENKNRDDIISQAREDFPNKKKYAWKGNPKIGWWADRNTVIFYHGTHFSRLSDILKNGLSAPTSGPTANWVSLALEPNTAFGYASMGGESSFRAAGSKAKHIPSNERVVLVLKIPMSVIKKNMEKEFRGNVPETRDKLTNKNRYDKFTGQDQEYYALTEIRFPKKIDPKWILGYMIKK